MEDIRKVPFVMLVDMLAKHTEEIMLMLREGDRGEAYLERKAMIKLLTAEIERRKARKEEDKA